jgi:hypothetical protein
VCQRCQRNRDAGKGRNTGKGQDLTARIIKTVAVLVVAGFGVAVATQVFQGPPGAADTVQTNIPEQLLARPCPKREDCLQSWTLTSRLGQILELYERRVGRRSDTYRLLGVEFTAAKRPTTWYPDFGQGPRAIIIQLTQQAASDTELALFQLSHEAFHTIEPIKPGSASSYLEEGLANYFAIDYLKSQGISGGRTFLTEQSYRSAYAGVVRLAELHGDFDGRLKSLRRQTKSFSRITAEDIRAAFPNAPEELARQLARRFP